MHSYDVVILGGGFAGVSCAQALTKTLRKQGRSGKIALIAQENHMVFQPMLPEVAGATLSPRHVVNPIRQLCPEANVFKAEAQKIHFSNHSLTVDPGSFVGAMDLEFKQLAVCLGAKIDLSRIPGMQEHALLIQNVGDAMRLRAMVISRFEEANLARDSILKSRLLSFVVIGGGYSGVETAGQLLDLAKAIHKYYKNIAFEDCRITLVHSRDHLLPTLHRALGKYTEKKLKQRGMNVKLNCRAKAVTANKVYLINGDAIESNTVISTVGNAPHPLVEQLANQLQLDRVHGRLQTRADCSINGCEGLWAAGDCAAVPHPEEGFCPSTAQFAVRQGHLLGKNIAMRLCDQPTRSFSFVSMGELVAIGHRSAVAEIKSFRFSGFFAWWMWRTIYLLKLPGFERKLRVIFEWTLELCFPHDINLLNPRYTKELSETHLEAGDVLFQAGEPAFSFYIVKEGAVELRDKDEVVKTIVAGQHFGERALLENDLYRFDAVATQPSTLITISNPIFKAIIESDEAFSHQVKQSARAYLPIDQLDRIIERLSLEVLQTQIGEIMTTDVRFLRKGSTVNDALDLIKQCSRNHLPVLDDKDRILGTLRKDALFLYLQTSELTRNDPIDSIPLEQLPEVQSDIPARAAMETMARNGASKLLVVDRNKKLVGVLALLDLLDRQDSI